MRVRQQCQTGRSFVLEAGTVTPEEYDTLYQQALIEMLADDFCGILFLLTAWGEKPLQGVIA